MTEDRIANLLKALTKSGLEATRLADDDSPCVVSEYISTGCTVLDAIMGGGLPCGRVVEIYGNTSTGKSLVASQACAAIQEEGGVAVYIDTETAVSLPIMEAVGVDNQTLVYLAPDTVEEVFKAMEAVVASKQPDEPLLIVWDSIAATSAEAEMNKATGDMGYPVQSRIISQGLRKFTRQIAKSGVACLFLNQAKKALGVMFGNSVATFGGKAVGFHSSIRVMMTVASKIKAGSKKKSRIIGVNVTAKVTKNKVAPPFREATLPIYFGHGIDEDLAILEFLKASDVITYANGYYSLAVEIQGLKDFPKFRKAGWSDIMDSHYDMMCELVWEAVSRGDLL